SGHHGRNPGSGRHRRAQNDPRDDRRTRTPLIRIMQTWDEHSWEAFIAEAERRSRETRRYLDTHLGQVFPSWEELFDRDPVAALDDYVEWVTLTDVSYFPDDDDDWEEDDEEDEG